MAKRREPFKRAPGVSYKADSPVHELHIAVRSTHLGTTVSLTYHEWAFGDEPMQGHMWAFKDESPKVAKGLQHLSNLAGWAVRRALAGHWEQRR